MKGYNALWVPGTDHASISTETKVIAKLAAEGIRKTDLTREQFLTHAWEWTEKHGGIILNLSLKWTYQNFRRWLARLPWGQSGAMVCLVKNLLHLFMTTTGGVGELSNFLLGAAFVVPAGLVYQRWKGRKSAVAGALAGAVLMASISIVSNYFIVYPVYYNFMPKEAILAAYQMIFPKVENILQCLIVFNAPFTFAKGVCSVAITMLVYKPLSPLLKGNYRSAKTVQKNTGKGYQA